jgi:Spy/CpxP family protein refolding chaperone
MIFRTTAAFLLVGLSLAAQDNRQENRPDRSSPDRAAQDRASQGASPDGRFAPGDRPGPAPGFAGGWIEGPWWNSPAVQELNLSDAQKTEIRNVVRDQRARLLELRSSILKAEQDLQVIFAEAAVDQKKANEAIDRLAAGRADLTRTLSQMTLKMRTILTADQWDQLQKRQSDRRRGGPGKGPGRGPGEGPMREGERFRPAPSFPTKQ